MTRADNVLNLVRRIRSGETKVAAAAPAPESEGIADVDGEEYAPVGVKGILAATGKLLAVNRGVAEVDDRDSWEFKRVMTPDALMAERVKMDASKMRRKISRMAAKKGTLQSVLPFAFDDDVQGLIIGNSLSSPLEEINPVNLLEQARRITLMGPGGINSSNAITEDMQGISASQFGFISPLEGPESERAGIDNRLATGVKFGSDGKLYQRFRNPKTGQYHWLSPEDLSGKTIRLPA